MKGYLFLLLLLLAGCTPGNRAEWRQPLGLEVHALGGSPGGDRVFVAADGVITSRDGDTGKELITQSLGGFEPTTLLNLGDTIIARNQASSELVWWQIDRFNELRKLQFGTDVKAQEVQELRLPGADTPMASAITGIGVRSDGTLAACGPDGTTELWNTGKLTLQIKTGGRVAGSGLSPDGTILTLIDSKRLLFYSIPQVEKLGEFSHGGRLRGLRYSPDSSYLAAILENQVILIHTEDSGEVASLPGVASSVSFSSDSRYFCATNVGTVDVWDLKKNRVGGSVTLLSVAQSEVLGERPHVLTLRKNGVDLWSLAHPEEPVWSYKKPVRIMRAKPDGVWLYTAGGWLESWRLPLANTP